jgi:hypothetical protein
MIDLEMAVATRRQDIIDLGTANGGDAAAARLVHGQLQDFLATLFGDNLHANLALTLKDGKHGSFAAGITSPFALAPATQMNLIKLHLTTTARTPTDMNPKGLSYGAEDFHQHTVRKIYNELLSSEWKSLLQIA